MTAHTLRKVKDFVNVKASPKLFAKLRNLAALVIVGSGILLEAILPSPVFADATVYADTTRVDSGTSTTPADAVDNNETTYGTFSKATGSTPLQAYIFFATPIHPLAGTALVVDWKWNKSGPNPFCNLYWDSTLDGTSHLINTYSSAGTRTETMTMASDVDFHGLYWSCAGNTAALDLLIYYVKVTYVTATPTATATATATFTPSNTPTGTLAPSNTPTATGTVFGDVPDIIGLQNGSFESPSLNPWEVHGGQLAAGSDGLQPLTGPAECGFSYFDFRPSFYQESNLEIIDGQAVNRPQWRENAGLAQRFYWPGGTAYFSAWVKRSSVDGTDVGVKLTEVTTNYDVPVGFSFASGTGSGLASSPDWLQITQTTSGPLPAGYYDLEISSGYEQHGSRVYVSDAPDLPNRSRFHFYIDDITLSDTGYTSNCTNGLTNTPSPTRTQTPTATASPTGTRTETPTATATSGPLSAWANCGFESGSNGWTGTNWTVQLAGGPTGPSYAQVNSGGNLRQSFSWTGGTVYYTFWIGPGSYGTVRLRDLINGSFTTLYIAVNPPAWARQTLNTPSLAAGSYALEFTPNTSSPLKVDGVIVSKNGYQYCGPNISGTASTPTSGPTSFITATSTKTPAVTNTASPTSSLTPSRTAFATNTQAATYTPQPTNTQPATSTLPATATRSSAQQTSTAQGTSVATNTPYPTYTAAATYTPYPTGTPFATPPQQPPAGSQDCVAPQSGDVAGWLAYQQCQAFAYVSWSPTNTAQLIALPTMAAGHEPFSTINQTGQFLANLNGLISGTDWSSTGSSCGNLSPDPSVFLHAAQGILMGDIQLNNSGAYTFDGNCSLLASAIIGPYISRAICIMLNLLCATGLLTWFQWLSNAIVILLFVAYFKKNWIDKAIV